MADLRQAAQQLNAEWADNIISDLHALFDTEMIREIDSGDALIRLNDAVAVVEEELERYNKLYINSNGENVK